MVSIYGGGSHPDSTRNIFRKAGVTPGASLAEVNVADYFQGEAAAGLWELWILCSRLSLLLEQCIAAAEPAYLARHAFQLAQMFNNLYQRHHILTEEVANRLSFSETRHQGPLLKKKQGTPLSKWKRHPPLVTGQIDFTEWGCRYPRRQSPLCRLSPAGSHRRSRSMSS